MTDQTLTGAIDLAPPTDDRTAQVVTTRLVHSALAGFFGDVEHGGEHYEISGPVTAEERPGQLDGIIHFHLGDGTRKHAIACTLMVAGQGLT